MLPCAQILKENKFLDFPLFLQTKLNAYWHGLLRTLKASVIYFFRHIFVSNVNYSLNRNIPVKRPTPQFHPFTDMSLFSKLTM